LGIELSCGAAHATPLPQANSVSYLPIDSIAGWVIAVTRSVAGLLPHAFVSFKFRYASGSIPAYLSFLSATLAKTLATSVFRILDFGFWIGGSRLRLMQFLS
jgi:hypothetical protein